MLLIQIPKQNDSMSRVVLDGTEYFLRMTWNTEGEFWSFGVWSNIDTPIVSGIRVVPECSLTRFARGVGIPSGVFYVFTTKNTIDKEDFWNGSAEFAYIPAEEVTYG